MVSRSTHIYIILHHDAAATPIWILRRNQPSVCGDKEQSVPYSIMIHLHQFYFSALSLFRRQTMPPPPIANYEIWQQQQQQAWGMFQHPMHQPYLYAPPPNDLRLRVWKRQRESEQNGECVVLLPCLCTLGKCHDYACVFAARHTTHTTHTRTHTHRQLAHN